MQKTVHFFIFFSALCGSLSISAEPVDKTAIIDFRTDSFYEDRLYELSGTWELYSGRLILPEDFSSGRNTYKPDAIVGQPLLFTTLPAQQGRLSPRNSLTLRSELVFRSGVPEVLGLRIPYMFSSYRLFINGREITARGKPALDPDKVTESFISRTAFFSTEGAVNEIVLHIANRTYDKIGIRDIPLIGNSEVINTVERNNIITDIFLTGLFLLSSVYHLILFNLRKQNRTLLFFSLASMMIVLRILSMGEGLLMKLVPALPAWFYMRMDYLTMYGGILFFTIYSASLYKGLFNRQILRAAVYVNVLLILLTVATPEPVYITPEPFYHIFALLLFFYTVYIYFSAVLRKIEGSMVSLVSILVFVAAVINDILYDHRIIHTGVLIPVGLVPFLFAQTYALSTRFAAAYREIDELSQNLIRVNELKDDFLANTGHELRTPINGIIGIVDSILSGVHGNVNKPIQENLEIILLSSRRLTTLIRDITDFSRLKHDEIKLSKNLIDVYTLAEIVRRLSMPLTGNRQVSVVNRLTPGKVSVIADENRLQQALLNLVSNAIKFTRSGTVEINAEYQPKGFLTISVTDEGPGIPEDKFDDIFEPFQQVESSLSRHYSGVGLGLAITKNLVERHDGRIEVESEIGVGSVFRIILPDISPDRSEQVRPVLNDSALLISGFDAADEPVDEKPGQIASDGDKSRTDILVIDDDYLSIKVVTQLLSAEYSVDSAEDGYQGLLKIESLKPDLVILDVMMPGLSGFETALRIREKYSYSELPILMLTAKETTGDIIEGLNSGANDYLSKPFEKDVLLARIENLLRLQRGHIAERELQAVNSRLQSVKEIQYSILPQKVPVIPGLRVHAEYQPCEAIGGDLYSFYQSENSLGIFIGDIAGHGLSAAMYSMMTALAFSLQQNYSDRPAELLAHLNSMLFQRFGQGYLTCQYLFIDMKQRIYRCANAGHPDLFIKYRNEVRALRPRGPVIGQFKDVSFETLSGDLSGIESFTLLTDGITPGSDEFFRADRVCNLLENVQPGYEVIGLWKALPEQGRKPGSDDRTVVSICLDDEKK